MSMRYSIAALCATVLLFACGPRQHDEQRTNGDANAIAEVFETDVAYTVHRMDSAKLVAYLRQHQVSREDSLSMVGFYERRNMQFAWFVNGKLSGAAKNLIGLMSSTDSLIGARSGPELTDLLLLETDSTSISLNEDSMRDLELELTAGFFRFASTRYGGFVSKDVRSLDWYIPRSKKDYSRLLDSLAAGSMDLSPMEPLHPQYSALKAHLRRYYHLDTLAPWHPLALGERRKLEPLDSASIIPDIRQRLMLLGDFVSQGDTIALHSTHYDSTLVKAVQRFQARHGLHTDGVIGPGVLRTLNITPGQRVRTMLVNMERLRWVPSAYPPGLLLVNIPEYRLHIFEQGEHAWSMDVVVGADATRTVIFSDTLSRIVFSPYWGVPMSIVQNEILPAMAKDPDYLARKGYERVGGSDSRPLIRQKPGPGNALGRVKFLFPNSYDIYLHDTPSKGAFARESRAFSHGCIRLSRPKDFAEYLLKADSAWPPERISKAMAGTKEITVTLPREARRPVFITYFTAWVAEGELNFRDDVYGIDAKLDKELFAPEGLVALPGRGNIHGSAHAVQ